MEPIVGPRDGRRHRHWLYCLCGGKEANTSLLGQAMKMPTARQIDRRLIGGSILFGIGWGIAGFCPGPVLVATGMGEVKALGFVVAMLVGMGIFELMERRVGCRASQRSPSDRL